MKKHLAANFLKAFLNVLIIASAVMLVQIVSSFIYQLYYGKSIIDMFTIKGCISFLVYLIYILITYNLRQILYSTNLTPFCIDNVKRFKTIGCYMFCIAIFDAMANFKRASGLEIFATKYGSLKGSFFMYIVLACMALVLAEIFKKAVEIKVENDFTV